MIQKIKNVVMKRQFFDYFLIGGFTTGLDFVLYWLIVDFFNVWYLLAAAMISPLTLGLNYSLHRMVTFKSGGQKRKQIPKYLGLVIFNYISGLSLLFIVVDVLGFNYLVGKLIVFVMISMWNYLALKFVVFR